MHTDAVKLKRKAKKNRNRNSELVVTPGKKGVKTKGGRMIESEKKVDRRKIASVSGGSNSKGNVLFLMSDDEYASTHYTFL